MSDTRHVISFLYTLRGPDGRVIDMSSPEAPIEFLAGSGMIIEGLDAALNRMTVGAKARVEVPAAEAYGERDPEQVRRVARSFLPVEGEVKVGDQFKTAPDPAAPIVTVIEVDGDEIVLDANHSLAGIDLTFDVEVVAMRPATPVELEHGHVHGTDGQCA